MKVAYVYDAVYPWEKGGAQKRVWELARRLADDHDVHLYGMHYWDGPSTVESEGVTLHGVCEPYELYVDGRRSIRQALEFASRLGTSLLAADYDVVDCQQFPYFPCFTAKAHEIARDSELVVTWYEVWDDYWYEYLDWKGAFGRLVERAVVSLPDIIVPISSAIRDDLYDIGRTNGLHVVENGVDYGGLQAVPAADEACDVVYVGRLAEHKRVDVLLEAVDAASERLERPVTARVVGDGPERERLESRASALGLDDQVTFTGFLEADEDVVGAIKAASVFVLPSVREGFPNTILEANACGVPAVVVDHPENGGTAVVEDRETGLVVDPDADAVAEAVASVLSDDALRRSLEAGARRFGEAHDWDVVVEQLECVYESARGGERR